MIIDIGGTLKVVGVVPYWMEYQLTTGNDNHLNGLKLAGHHLLNVNELDEVMYVSRLPAPCSNSGIKSTYKQEIRVY